MSLQIQKQSQEPTLEPTIHALAKPAMRAAAWSLVAVAGGALAAAALRTLRNG